jgi:hypothetical protein
MPIYRLNLWMTQTLRDEAEYSVEAESQEAAIKLLTDLYDEAGGDPVSHPQVTAKGRSSDPHEVWLLDPQLVEDDDWGVEIVKD